MRYFINRIRLGAILVRAKVSVALCPLWVAAFVGGFVLPGLCASPKIDRHALVTRHNVTLTNADPLTPLTVGNGRFAFTADITGLQTFPEFYDAGIPLHTLSEWGWHSFPNPENYRMQDALKTFDVHGRPVTEILG